MAIFRSTDRKATARLTRSRDARLRNAELVARRIIADVSREGDRALIRWTRKLDGVDLRARGFTVSPREIRRARMNAAPEFVRALRRASRNIRAVARQQIPREFEIETDAGVTVGQIVRPLDRVACYVPGGRFPLPSTVLMSVIPAQVAGVREIFIASPNPAPAVLVAADLLGVEKIYRLGGAQAIAAFAFGTAKVPRADKLVGPGNRYVAAAKKLVAGDCGIDFVAGPTELVVIADRGRANWIAWDLIAQAEHDPDALALLITPSRRLARAVQSAAESILHDSELSDVRRGLEAQGGIIVTRDLDEAADLANAIAPEHLMLLGGATRRLDSIASAGSIFLGDTSAVAAGDYAAGSNHILPTAGAARMHAGLSAADFVKTVAVQRVSKHGLERLKPTIVALARAEGLEAHARSIEARFNGSAAGGTARQIVKVTS